MAKLLSFDMRPSLIYINGKNDYCMALYFDSSLVIAWAVRGERCFSTNEAGMSACDPLLLEER